MLLSFIGYFNFCNGNIVISNYHLNFPHTLIESVADFYKLKELSPMGKKCLLLDDFERWFHSRSSSSNINKIIGDITMDFGKLSISSYISAKRYLSIDLGFRDVCDFFCNVSFKKKYNVADKRIQGMFDSVLEGNKICVDMYDHNLEYVSTWYLDKLEVWKELYSTTEIVKDIVK